MYLVKFHVSTVAETWKSILEGVQLGLKQDVLVLECCKLALVGSDLGHDLLDGWGVWISHG
jgi:hypothetical protein